MMRIVRGLLLGAVAIGIWLALTAAPSSGGPRGQATGYGDDVLQPCPAGQSVGPNGEPCLGGLEIASPASDGGSDGGSNTVKYIFIGGMVLLIGGGVAYLISYTDFLARFRRS